MNINREKTIVFSPLHRLQWEEAQDCYVILYPEGIVKLNPSAAEILKLCEDKPCFDELVQAIENKFETTGLADDVAEFVEDAMQKGWVTYA